MRARTLISFIRRRYVYCLCLTVFLSSNLRTPHASRIGRLFVLRSWYVEHHNFTYGSPHNVPEVIGHYTQMVWASTHKVGCAVTKCAHGGPRNKPFFNYVCDYCPA